VLQQAGQFAELPNQDPTLALFQKHFIVMHCLYRLQRQYAEEGMALFISPLRVQLSSASESVAGEQRVAQADAGLHEFYGDWSNFTAATPDSVADLLSSFWRRYAARDQTDESLQVLGLSAGADWTQVQAQYRRLATEHHPDKGGDSAQFGRVREAYETLKARFKG
jgi:hypothetical protein